MGVHGLWDLLAPVGRRVSVETLAGRRLAIDASIWMIQFMKAMRDDRGEMIRNAHLVGFFRRICKLLFLRTKPVFVFDGGTPALKRRTVIARRRQRENSQAKIRKTAEKLLLNQLKTMRLKELAASLENQKLTKGAKGKNVVSNESGSLGSDNAKGSRIMEEMDELLAASLAAKDCDRCISTDPVSGKGFGNFEGSVSTSTAAHHNEDDEDDEEMILPLGNGGVDPSVLAALPPSMQLDLLVQMRERLMAENRQRYQRVKKAPQKFSELQIESYLKTVAFRREIDEVQKAAAGKGMDGVQTSRIASEANREFIFSSSYSGDKQQLASAGATKKDNRVVQSGKERSSFDVLSSKASTVLSHVEATSAVDEHETGDRDEVLTYLDERGHVRVSRVRAMGIRMTRDLQRNLDLMRELEQERLTTNEIKLAPLDLQKNVLGDSGNSDFGKEPVDTTEDHHLEQYELMGRNSFSAIGGHTHTAVESGNTMEISFQDNEDQKSLDDVDGLFADLVAEKPMIFSTIDDSPPVLHSSEPALDCEWEEEVVGEEPNGVTNAQNFIELDWEEGLPGGHVDGHLSPSSYQKSFSKGSLEEEVALQEAIRRSLEDFTARMSAVPSESEHTDEFVNHTSSNLLQHAGSGFQIGKNLQVIGTPSLLVSDSDNSSPNPCSDAVSGKQLTSTIIGTSHDMGVMMDFPKNFSSADQSRTEDAGTSSVLRELMETKSVGFSDADRNENSSHAKPMCYFNEASDISIYHEESTIELAASDIHLKEQLNENCNDLVQEKKHDDESCTIEPSEEDNIEYPISSLEDELQDLSREYVALGEEQRKLERNAESVNSEMFVECQELLQMFGLPYIIAPMEAEAQCAFMEHVGLVDGVVTDDSDVFLFGARSVYKNIFDDRKYVETYFMKDIEDELGLDQEKLIRMALLLGSDYTEGISGIGIVNAIEVINAFTEEDGLYKFREWIESPDPMILGKLGMKSKSTLSDKGSSCSKTDGEGTPIVDSNDFIGNNDCQAESNIQNLRQIFMDKHRNVSKNWHVPSSFPSEAVISAYRSPQVDKSTDPFSWGRPDLFALRRLCWEKFGWGSPKADELLLPVLKEYNKHETQLRLEAFYTFNERFAKIRSKRIKQAVKGITKNQSTELTGEVNATQGAPDDVQKRTGRSTTRKSKRKKPKDDVSRVSEHSVEHSNQPRKKRAQEVGTGIGKAKLRAKPPVVGSGRRKMKSASETSETSSDGADCIDDLEHGLLAGKSKGPHFLRKSMRRKKATSYVESDVEIDESLHLEKHQENDYRTELDEQQLPQDHSIGRDGAAGCCSGVQPHVNSLDIGDLSNDYLVKGGGFCADEDEAERDEQCSSLHGDGVSCDANANHLQADGSFAVNVDMCDNEHEYDPFGTAAEATEIPSPPSCVFEAKMGENNSIEQKLIKSFRGSLEGLHQQEQIIEDQDDQHLIRKENVSKDSLTYGNSVNNDHAGVKVSSDKPYLRRNKLTRSSR